MPRPRPIKQIVQSVDPNLPPTQGDVLVDLNAAGPAPPDRIVYGSSVAATTISSATGAPTSYQHGAINPDVRATVTARSDAPILQSDDNNADDTVELRRTEQRAKERREKFRQTNTAAHNAALQWGQQQAAQAAAATQALAESQLDTIETAITAAESEAEATTQAWADAMSRGDYVTAGREQRKMMSAQSRIETLKAGKDELAQNVRQKPRAAAPPPQAAVTNDIEKTLASLPNLIDSEREWIRSHPETIQTQEGGEALRVAFRDSQTRGLQRGSREYFAFFNERLGYDDAGDDEEEEPPMPQPRRTAQTSTPRVSAPVNRTGGGTLKPGQFILTQAQREAARISGTDEVTYARGLQRLMEMKAQGMYGASEQK